MRSRHCVWCGAPLGPVTCSGCGRVTSQGLRAGAWVLDRYQLRADLGRDGGWARWSCVDSAGEAASVLVFDEDPFEGDRRDRLTDALRYYQGLSLPHVEPLHEIGALADGTLAVSWGWRPGPTLATLVDTHGPMPTADAVRLIEQVAQGLAALHTRGLLHADLRPERIVWASDGVRPPEAWLQESGSMVALIASGEAMKNTVFGSPAYMAPERFTGVGPSPRSDLYEFGLMAYEALEGRHPFEAKTPWEWATCHLTRTPRMWTGAMQKAPRLCEAVSRCLAKEPERRFSSAERFLAAAMEPAQDDLFGPIPPWSGGGPGPYRAN